MFVKNSSDYEPVLSRGTVYGDIGVACICVELVFDILDDGTLRLTDHTDRADTDPPDIRRTLLWRGTSVTAFGHVHGPSRGPHAATVRISVGDHAVDLAIYGNRRWERAPWGGWTQSAPEPFDAIPLTWDRAFGGTVQLEPGFFPGTELPHPGGPIPHAYNPDGMGFIIDREAAHGVALPNIEDPAALMAAPTDAPHPVGCAPCPKRPALRPLIEPTEDRIVSALQQSLLTQHHAPTPLLFTEPLAAGAPIEAHGLNGKPLSFILPSSPLSVALRRGSRTTPTRERIRSLHIDGDTRRARVTYAHFERYESRRSPRHIIVEAAA